MVIRRSLLLAILLAPGLAPAVQAQDWVSAVKAAPQDYRGRRFVVEGEVVEIRALSPRSERGLYRLVDGSDPSGVLIRTAELPRTGGPFRVRVRLAPELLSEGALLLEEVERDQTGFALAPLAIGITLAGIAGLLVALLLFLGARREARLLHLGQPMWLIPSGAEGREADPVTGKPADFNYALHYIAEERSRGLDRRRRFLLALAMLSAAVTVGGASVFGVLRRADASLPAFVLLTPEISSPGPADTGEVALRPDDTLRLGLAPAPAREPAPPRTTEPERVVREPDRRPAPPPPAPARVDTVTVDRPAPVVEQPVVVPPPPPPISPPPPPPVVAPRDTAPPAPDPAVLAAAARRELEASVQRLVRAINSRNAAQLATLYPTGGTPRDRENFFRFVQDARPSASLLTAAPPTLGDASVQGDFAIRFSWRGDFGVQRQRDVRFRATLRRAGAGWSLTGFRLLETFP
jgi:hypothetical protein